MGLADPASSRQGHQSHAGGAEQREHGLDLGLATDEGSQLRLKSAGGANARFADPCRA